MSEFGQTVGSGFGGFFTRTFSLVTLILGLFLFVDPTILGPFSPGDVPVEVLTAMLCLLGLHGTLTNMSEVGIIRRFLCYMSGVPGAVVVFNIVGQILNL